ncbi:unnamed protein product [Moneuplotes crassus]|uniref:EamA domain-containing protein n=1 Tax=Euplotes crassus TaxID=5936 RepID=A0AAD1XI72_EUPCR|nr:unnamed protein product [Moneuplotes crassus]
METMINPIKETAKHGLIPQETPNKDVPSSQSCEQLQSFGIEDEESHNCIEPTEKSLYVRLKGISIGLFSKIIFIICLTSLKYCYLRYETITGFDYILFRGFLSIISSGIEARYSRVNVFYIPKDIRVGVLLRFLTGMIGIPCFFIAMKYLPTSQCHITLNIYPLMNAILAYFVLSEVLHIRDIFLLFGAFIGAYAINSTESTRQGESPNKDEYKIGITLVLVALIFRSTALVAMRIISRSANSVYSPFYYALGMLTNAVTLLLFFRDHLHFQDYTIGVIFFLSVAALFDYCSQSMMSYASKFEKATALAPLSYATTCLILINDLVLFHYEFKLMYFVGFVIIFVCVLVPILYKIYF